MKRMEKLTTLLGIVLLFCAAFFLVSLMVQFLDFGVRTQGHNTIFFSLGKMLFTVYGFSSFCVPVYLFIAALMLFFPGWTTRKGVYLAISIVPFFTLVATERAGKVLFANDTGSLLIIKICAALVIAALVIAIEYLVAGILSDLIIGKASQKSSVKEITKDESEAQSSVNAESEQKPAIETEIDKTVKSDSELTPVLDSESSVDSDAVANSEIQPVIETEKEVSPNDSILDYMDAEMGSNWVTTNIKSVPKLADLTTEELSNEKKETPTKSDIIVEYPMSANEPKDPHLRKEELDALLAPYPTDSEDSQPDSEFPVESETSVESEIPVENEMSVEPETSELETPVEPEISVEPEMPVENEIPIEPAEKVTPSVEPSEPEIQEDSKPIPVVFSVPELIISNSDDIDDSDNIDDSDDIDDIDDEIIPDIEDENEDLYSDDEAQFMEDPFDDEVIEEDSLTEDDILIDEFVTNDDEHTDEIVEELINEEESPIDEGSVDEETISEISNIPFSSVAPVKSSNNTDDALIPRAVPSRQKNAPYAVPTDLLTQYPDGEYWIIDKATQRAAIVLKETLNEFKIQAEVTGIRKGPVITMFEILPAPGVKLNRIVALQDNIALRLAASSVRIVAPIPGKSAVGIEVPNKERAIVGFKELIETDTPAYKKMAIPVVLGKDITGEAQLLDLAKTPHLLIAGSTGSGKSVCVNSMILSILYKRSPAEVRMILIDPKVVELKLYNDIPHLLTPVITEPKKAFQALQYCLCEMERRYALLDGMGVREINSYNRRIVERDIATEKLPYIVVIIDEFADLMATTGKELESTVARLAAMSRAVGIHLVLATQRPSIDVITGLIKANIPSRIAFMVASKMDSRIIIDQVGAEKLLGRGDMLYASATDPFPVRIQGTFVSDTEVENVVEFVKQYGEPEYIDEEIFVDDEEDEGNEPSLYSESGEDPLYEKALDIVVQAGKASASYIQRRLKIGYNRAARLVEEMEDRGIVGPANGSKPREIIHVP